MAQLLGILGYGLVLLFGVAVSVRFSGVPQNKKNIIRVGCFFLFGLFLQIVSWQLWGMEQTKALYPFIVHLPLVIFLSAILKRPWLISVSSVLAAYLCCQIPKWTGAMSALIFRTQISYYISYILAMALSYFCLRKYVAVPTNRIMMQSKKSCLLFAAVPLFYYLFDYITTIYTDWLYSGSKVAVQFIPSIVSVFYFVFVIIYYAEIQKEKNTQRERDLMASQLKQARIEFDTLSRMQEQTRQYRHDMRHHFSLIQSLAAKGDVQKILSYLQTVEDDLEAFTPVRYCSNETINLLLSFFETKAKQAGIAFSAEANVPDVLPLRNTELCSLLSNGLENAIAAARCVSKSEERMVSARIIVYKEKMLLSVQNSYEGDVVLRDGLPQTDREGHGYGTRNISAIADLYGGQALFSANAGVFTLKVMIPLS